MQSRSRVRFSFFLNCLHYNIHATLLHELKSVDENTSKLSNNKLINLLLYGNPNLTLIRTLVYWIQPLNIIKSGRFAVPLLQKKKKMNEREGVNSFLYYLLPFILLSSPKHDWIIHYWTLKKVEKIVLLITTCIFIFVHPKFHRNCILQYFRSFSKITS